MATVSIPSDRVLVSILTIEFFETDLVYLSQSPQIGSWFQLWEFRDRGQVISLNPLRSGLGFNRAFVEREIFPL